MRTDFLMAIREDYPEGFSPLWLTGTKAGDFIKNGFQIISQ